MLSSFFPIKYWANILAPLAPAAKQPSESTPSAFFGAGSSSGRGGTNNSGGRGNGNNNSGGRGQGWRGGKKNGFGRGGRGGRNQGYGQYPHNGYGQQGYGSNYSGYGFRRKWFLSTTTWNPSVRLLLLHGLFVRSVPSALTCYNRFHHSYPATDLPQCGYANEFHNLRSGMRGATNHMTADPSVLANHNPYPGSNPVMSFL